MMDTAVRNDGLRITDWLPTSVKEVAAHGWSGLDIVLFTGDAYVDHPSFGAAVIARALEAAGYRVAVVPQPNWRDDLRDFRKMGVPRLFFCISGGCMDSMVNHYTANRRLRSDDAYTAGGAAGQRPDDAVTVYVRILKSLFPDVPVVIGGIEASLRRFTHYDYWRDALKPSIMLDSGADLLVYGMGEHVIRRVAARLDEGCAVSDLTDMPQTVYLTDAVSPKGYGDEDVMLHAYEDCVADRRKFAANFCMTEAACIGTHAVRVIEPAGGRYVVANPPARMMDGADADFAFDLPYTRLPHPRYSGKRIPAFDMIQYSVNIHRGCFGGCSFCAVSVHQGKSVVSRSERSILDEIRKVAGMPGFRGVLTDLGGPSANMYGMRGRDGDACKRCRRCSCLYPSVCRNLNNSHERLLALYAKVRGMAGIRKVFIGSGIRYDLFLTEDGFMSSAHARYFSELVQHHVSGRLKVAPEHTSARVLKAMRKPRFELFLRMKREFDLLNGSMHLRQQVVPYFISSHPGCSETDMRHLAMAMRQMRFDRLEQVQDFTPTPMTLSSVMFYCGFDPYTGEQLYVARKREEKLKQKEYFFRR